jgi:hypothetical protein
MEHPAARIAVVHTHLIFSFRIPWHVEFEFRNSDGYGQHAEDMTLFVDPWVWRIVMTRNPESLSGIQNLIGRICPCATILRWPFPTRAKAGIHLNRRIAVMFRPFPRRVRHQF